MRYWLHPAAAEEHKKQVAHYEEIQVGLGRRYNAEFRHTLEWVTQIPMGRFFVAQKDAIIALMRLDFLSVRNGPGSDSGAVLLGVLQAG